MTSRSDGPILLGIDPGQTGAAAIVDGDEVVWRCRWRPRQRQGRRVYEVTTPDRAVLVPSMEAVGAIIADAASEWCIDAGACEGQALARRSGMQSVLSLARSAAAVSALVRLAHPEPWTWPTCRQWRPRVGIPPASRAQHAKRAARDLVRQRAGLEVAADEAEAICIAWSLQT